MLSLSGCFMGDPRGAVFGYRLVDGVVEVAYPLCRGHEVAGVELRSGTSGDGEGPFLWNGKGPRSEAVRHGVFTVDAPASFTTTTAARPLPWSVYVDVAEDGGGGMDDFLDLPKVRAFHATGPDSWFTEDGPRSRAEVNAQMGCNRPRTASS
ncbi:hypothetical protein [Streptomyces sp. NRRL F-5123]|uniref:hypothetical protein n=1 Tax=Streptomyces sp. NRRL F-5123 TaxID=1463856 RepID=UPI0004E10C24|nr:hypothetical protein [Streptomyces sp. NRRL F-5123]